jgi:hypothetical protein
LTLFRQKVKTQKASKKQKLPTEVSKTRLKQQTQPAASKKKGRRSRPLFFLVLPTATLWTARLRLAQTGNVV